MIEVYAKPREQELSELEKYIGSDNNPKFFFSMTQIDKLGINPKSNYSTPIGIYAYPLTKEYYKKLINFTLPFAGDQPHIQLFTLNMPTFNLANYSPDQLKADTKTIKRMYGVKDSSIANAYFSARENTPISKFWNLTRLTSKTPTKWNALLRNLGYTNFYDPGEGVIYPSEPVQIVVLDPSVIIHFGKFSNKSDDYNLDKYKKLIDDIYLHKHLTPDMLNNLSTHILYTLWSGSINHHYTIANMIAKILIQKLHNNNYICQVIAGNPYSSYEVLEILSNSSNIYTRENVARNNATSLEILRKLSDDTNAAVRISVANNPKTPKDILIKLTNDIDGDVRHLAKSKIPFDTTTDNDLVSTACDIFEFLTK
jgi:hypothetical protein